MAVHAPPATAEELLRLPGDGLRRELVQGELRAMCAQDTLDLSDAVPGFSVAVAELFA
jgi:hypothetical protein